MKKILITLIWLLSIINLFADVGISGSNTTDVVTVGWDQYSTNDPTIISVKVYAMSLSPSNSLTLIFLTSITNNTLSMSNLTVGSWTFVATAVNINGLESLPTLPIGTTVTNVIILPDTPSNFQFITTNGSKLSMIPFNIPKTNTLNSITVK